MTDFVELFRTARAEGLGITLHIAEVRLLSEYRESPNREVEELGPSQTKQNSAEETKALLSCEPERLGHATYLDDEAKELVLARRTCIEICLTSNLLSVFPFFA